MAALATVALVSVVLAACGTDSDSPATSQDSPGEVASSDASTGKVSANNASEEELLAAFEEAGIPNAKQWSHEVEEYRPYPVDDPSFQRWDSMSIFERLWEIANGSVGHVPVIVALSLVPVGLALGLATIGIDPSSASTSTTEPGDVSPTSAQQPDS